MKSRAVLLAELLNGAPVAFMALSKFWGLGAWLETVTG